MSQENLMCGVDFIPSRVDYSYCNSSNNSYSVIGQSRYFVILLIFVMSESHRNIEKTSNGSSNF